MIRTSLLPMLLLAALLSADIGAPSVYHTPAGSDNSAPDWITVDAEAKTLHIALEAGQTEKANYWNFNGYNAGEATVSVPKGYTVTIAFTNSDPVMVHSAAVIARTEELPALFEADSIVFEGAATSHPTDMVKATASGGTEEISFVASETGDYLIACLIPGHAAIGMWIGFTVTDGGSAGVTTPE